MRLGAKIVPMGFKPILGLKLNHRVLPAGACFAIVAISDRNSIASTASSVIT